MKWYEKIWRKFIRPYYFDEDGGCIKCPQCNCEDIKWTAVDTINNTVSEVTLTCSHCYQNVGYWAYGYHDPFYMMEFIGDNRA